MSHFPISFDRIQTLIPHRYPFLFVDRVISIQEETSGSLVGRQCEALKNVTGDEYFFVGHFPEFSVMPGVLIIEALAQTALLCASGMPQDKPVKEAFLASIQEAKFKKPVIPGDILQLNVRVSKARPPFFLGAV